MEMISKLKPVQVAQILMMTMVNRRIPKDRCKHPKIDVARDVTIQLPLKEGCLRSENDLTISKKVASVTFCANPCCEFVIAMERK
jgi:hypothetical protein